VQQLNRETNIKNLCFGVIILIIVCNFLQVRSLGQNGTDLKDAVEEIVSNLKTYRLELEEEKLHRVSNATEMRNAYQKEIESLKKKLKESSQNMDDRLTRQQERFSKI
jgi:protein subunit release factor A